MKLDEKKTQNKYKELIKDVTRIEVIDENGRSYVNKNDGNKVWISLQDDGRTMKVFIDQVK